MNKKCKTKNKKERKKKNRKTKIIIKMVIIAITIQETITTTNNNHSLYNHQHLALLFCQTQHTQHLTTSPPLADVLTHHTTMDKSSVQWLDTQTLQHPYIRTCFINRHVDFSFFFFFGGRKRGGGSLGIFLRPNLLHLYGSGFADVRV